MIPKPLYEALPVAYIVVAIAVIAALDSTIGLMSLSSLILLLAGLLLGMAGVVVLAMRDSFRRNAGQRSTRSLADES